ncbi:hypothetical protein MKW92_014667 [Papaver armeniacum]|nr:hypothetical protein MKW92_014667 [Papaver armeniacum]
MYVNQIPKEKLRSLRRISLFTGQNELSPFPELLSVERMKLRAFLCASPEFVDNAYAMEQVFKNFRRLRVLDLSYYPIDELPPSIADSKYLRYLNLSNSRLRKLPTSITALYNLQILILKNCLELKDLPRDMRKLKNLRHLIICKSKSQTDEWIPPMPSQVRKLINLQYLPVFTVGDKNHGFGIGELSTLNLLGRKLHIHNLENVSTREDAEGARIGEKQHILWLELHWTFIGSCVHDDLEVLEGLQPHRNLNKLGIYDYLGSSFSTWMMNLNNLLPKLAIIVLENCSKCEYLPPLGLLTSLKVLKIKGFRALKRIGREILVGNSSSVFSFPCLEDLSIQTMENLEEWNDHISESSSFSSSFPVLKKLEVKLCPKLRILPNRISSLKDLVIECCTSDEEISSLVKSSITSLTSVIFKECNELVFLPAILLEGNSILEYLEVDGCSKFKGFNVVEDHIMEEEDVSQDREARTLESCPSLISPSFSRFNYLVELNLQSCESLESLPSGIENLPRLEWLTLGPFSEELSSFPFPAANIIEETVAGNYFPSLYQLHLFGWDELNCLPDQIQHITSLRNLGINYFDSLEVLPEWLGNMVFLKDLFLNTCAVLEYMPSKEQMLRLTSLKKLEIVACPILFDRCKEVEEEYNKISHIPNVNLAEK